MKKMTTKKFETEIDYEAIIDGFDPAKWREATPEEMAEHRERAKDAVIVEVQEPTDAEYLEMFENFDPAKWREGTPEELAEHRERAKDAVIVEIEEIEGIDKSEER